MQTSNLCTCGAPVHTTVSYSPSYDDGGSIDAIDVEEIAFSKCIQCLVQDIEHLHHDDLPF